MEWIIGGGGSGYHPKVSHICYHSIKVGGPHVQGVMIASIKLVFLERAFKLVQLTTLLTELESSYYTFKRSMCMESPILRQKS